jgi:hypothetical protein
MLSLVEPVTKELPQAQVTVTAVLYCGWIPDFIIKNPCFKTCLYIIERFAFLVKAVYNHIVINLTYSAGFPVLNSRFSKPKGANIGSAG